MNTQHTLILLAASVGSFCIAQTPPAPAPSPSSPPAAATSAAQPSPLLNLIAELNTPEQASVLTPEQRIAVLPDLALMPQEVDSFVVLPDVGALQARFCPEGKKSPVKSLAVGYSKGAEEMAGTMGELVALFLNARMLLRSEVEWEAAAGTPEIQRMMHESMVAYRKATMQRLHRELCSQGNGPIYAVATLTPETRIELMGLKPMLLGICAAHPKEFQYIEQGKLFGIRHTPETNIGPVPQAIAGAAPELKEAKEGLEKDMKALPMTVMFFHAGNQLLLAACSNPEEVRIAGSVADSLLNTDKVAALDSKLNRGLVLGAHFSPTMQQALSRMGSAGTQYVLGMAQAVFSRLGEQPGDFQKVYQQAAQGTVTLRPLTRWGLPKDFRNAADLSIWMDTNLHLELTHDADELVFESGALSLVGVGSMQEQAMYFESTPSHAKETPAWRQNLHAFRDIMRGYVCTGSPGQAVFTLSLCDTLGKHLEPVTQALSEMKDSLSTNFSMLVSSGSTPESLQPLMGPVMPIVAYRAGVKNRGQLQQAWDKALAGTHDILGEMLPPGTTMLPRFIEAKCPAGGTSLTLDMPGMNSTFSPGLVLTDHCVVLGSSGAMNCLVSQNQDRAPMFSGMVFALHFQPMARMAQSIAGQMEQNLRHRFPVPPQPVKLTQVTVIEAESAPAPAAGDAPSPGSAQQTSADGPQTTAQDQTPASANTPATANTPAADTPDATSAEILLVEQSDNAAILKRYHRDLRRLETVRRQAATLENLSRYCRGIYAADRVHDGKATLRVDALMQQP